MTAAETLFRRERVTRTTTELSPAVVVIESNPQIRGDTRQLLEGWGLRVLEPDLASAMPIHDELGHCAAVIADFELEEIPERTLPYTGLDLALLVARRAGRRLPTLVISSSFGRQAIPACSPHHFPVLFRPVQPDMLRSWLVTVGVLHDGPRWTVSPELAE